MQNKENKLMAENTSKEISHHSKELESAVHKTAHIPAWVIAKLERSSTDLSDVTHYLDGDPKFAQGGGIVNLDKIKNNIGEVLYKFIGSLNKEQAERMLTDLKAEIEFELKTQSTSARYSRLIDEQNLLLYRLGRDNEMKMAQGGGIDKNLPVGQRVSSEKINKFIDYVYGFYGKGGIYARDFNGGLTKAQITRGVNEYIEELDQQKTWGGGDSLDRERVREYLESKKYAQGGEIDEDEKYELAEKLEQDVTSYIANKKGISQDEAMAIIQDQNGREYFIDTISFTKDVKSKWSTIVQNLGDEFISINDDEDFSYRKGGKIGKSTFKYYKVPNEKLWAIQECNSQFADEYGSQCIVIRNKKSEAEAIKEVERLNKMGKYDYFANGGGIEKEFNTAYFDKLSKGDKVTITYGDPINRLGKAELVVKSKTLVGKGKSWESDKITFINANNPTGINWYALKRKDSDKVGLAIGDMGIWNVKVVSDSTKFADGGGIDSSKKRYILKNYSVSTDDVKMVDGKEEEIRGTHHNSTYSIGKTFYSKADLVEFIASKVQTNRKLTESDFNWNNERKEITISILGSFTHNSEPKVNELKKFNKGEIELIKKLYTFSVDAVIFTEYKNGGSTENEEDSVVEFRIYKDGKFAGTKKELWSKFQERKGRLIDPTDYFRDEDYTIPYFEFEPFDDNKNMNNYFVMEWDYKNEAGLDYPIETWVAPHYVSNWMEKGGGVDDIDMNEVEKSAIFYTDETRWSTKPTIAKFEKELAENKELLNKLERKEISPAKIVGGGYRSSAIARKLAFKYLKEKVLISERAIEILKERGETFATGGGVGSKELLKEYENLKNKKSKLKDILYKYNKLEVEKYSNIPFGAGMRKSKISISTTKTDKIKSQIKDIDKKIENIENLRKSDKEIIEEKIKELQFNKKFIYDNFDVENEKYKGYLKDIDTEIKSFEKKLKKASDVKKFATGGTTPKQQKKIGKVMHEFKEGDLKTSAGTKVTNPKQAVAIALSEAGVPKKGWGHKKSLRK